MVQKAQSHQTPVYDDLNAFGQYLKKYGRHFFYSVTFTPRFSEQQTTKDLVLIESSSDNPLGSLLASTNLDLPPRFISRSGLQKLSFSGKDLLESYQNAQQ